MLGDIVDSQPVYVQAPFANYTTNGYDAFKAAQRGAHADGLRRRQRRHAARLLRGTRTRRSASAAQEAWAVIPSAVLPNLYKLADDNYKRGGHQFYVDGTPVVGDVFDRRRLEDDPGRRPQRRRQGLLRARHHRRRRRPKALWEFKQDPASCSATAPRRSGNRSDCNLGLTFGKPVVTKLGRGTWVVMVTSGYNNINAAGTGDGGGYLYVLNARTGEIIYKIATGAGSGATPSGLAQINNYVDNVPIDNTTLRVYGGDVLGNIWRFDFLPAPRRRCSARPRTSARPSQPITVRPELAELDGKPFVMFGTGRLLGSTDVTDPQVQSVYGFRDPLIGAAPIYADPSATSLRP